MTEVISRFGLSFRRVCRLAGWNRSSLQYQPQGRDDTALRERLRHWAARKPRWGAPILHDVLKAEGLVINPKRTGRIYREEGLSLRRKCRKKLLGLARVPIPQPERPNERWSMDFIHDQLSSGRRFRCLTIVDDFTRQCLAIHVDTSIGGAAVVNVLEELALTRSLPKIITLDNGYQSDESPHAGPPVMTTNDPKAKRHAEAAHRLGPEIRRHSGSPQHSLSGPRQGQTKRANIEIF
jgi:putative transposase